MMNIVIMCQTASRRDRLGYEIEQMYRLLSKSHQCRVFAARQDRSDIAFIDRSGLEKAASDGDTSVIYYHSGSWREGPELLEKVVTVPIIRYCGIAPKVFFEGYDERRYYDSLMGRTQTGELQKLRPDALWLCASKSVARDLKDVQRIRIGVCPPFSEVEERYDGVLPDEYVLRELIESTTFNLLYNGPISPECGIMQMLDILAVYRDIYTPDIRLRLLNSRNEECRNYRDAVRRRIDEYGLQANVQFIGRADAAGEVGWYLGCDAMLCCDSYGGFCESVARAQYFRLPVLGGIASSTPEALGINQLSFEDDPRRFAAAIDTLRRNGELARTLGRIGAKNFERRLSTEAVGRAVMAALEKGKWGA